MNQKSNALTTRPPLFQFWNNNAGNWRSHFWWTHHSVTSRFFLSEVEQKKEKFPFLFQRGTANNVELESKRMKKTLFVPTVGLEPTTLRLKVWCSTNWARRAPSSCVGIRDEVKKNKKAVKSKSRRCIRYLIVFFKIRMKWKHQSSGLEGIRNIYEQQLYNPFPDSCKVI